MHKQLTIRYMTFWEKSTTRFSNDNKKCKQIASPQITQIAAYIFWSLPNGMARTVHDPKWSRPQMIPKIDLNTTRNDPRPQIIPQFFSHATEMTREELLEWNGMTFNSWRC